MLIAMIVYLNSKQDTIIDSTTLWVLTICAGIEFAIFGQVYQTGVDAYNLFVAWSFFALGFIIISKSSINWLTFLILINTSTYLYATQSLHVNFIEALAMQIILNFLSLCILYQITIRKGFDSFTWLYKLNYIYLILLLSILLTNQFIDTYTIYFLFVIMYAGVVYYSHKEKSMIVESISVLSLVFIFPLFIMSFLPKDNVTLYYGVILFLISSFTGLSYLRGEIKGSVVILSFEKLPWMTHVFVIIISIFASVGILSIGVISGILTKDNWLFLGITVLVVSILLKQHQHKSLGCYYGFFIAILLSEIAILIGLGYSSTLKDIMVINMPLPLLLMIAIQIMLYLVIKDYIHRILNILLFCSLIIYIDKGPLSYVNGEYVLLTLSAILVMLVFSSTNRLHLGKEFKDGIIMTILILILPIAKYVSSSDTEIIQLFTSFLLFFVVYKSLKTNSLIDLKTILLIIVAIGITSYVPSLHYAIILLIIGLYLKEKYLILFSFVSCAVCISLWYYNIELSLLYKSIYMIIAGVSIIANFYFLNKKEQLCEK